MSVAATLLSSARRYRGVSGRALARQTASSQAGLVGVENGTADATTERLDRILRTLDYQVVALPTRLGTASDAGEDIRRYLEVGNEDAAFRVVLQLATDLTRADPALRVALCVTPPALSGNPKFDALLAGIVEWRLSTDGLPLPSWVSEDARTLIEPWDVEPVPGLQEAARKRTPDALRRHGIYLDPVELADG